MLSKLLSNHILTNLTFGLVVVIGWLSYDQMPREQDPSINFNWVQIWTYWPGASAIDVEKRITEPLEDGLSKVQDIRFVSSASREGISSILVRFESLADSEFNARITDLRRELHAKYDELPSDVDQPDIFEISSSNAFPTATVAVWGQANDHILQAHARDVREDLERLPSVDRITPAGTRNPELKIHFLPERLLGLGISPVDLAETVRTYFRDVAAGSLTLGDQEWLIRLLGTSSNPVELGVLPLLTVEGELPLRSVAEIENAWSDPQVIVAHNGQPTVLLSIFKKSKANNLVLLDAVRDYLHEKNAQFSDTGVKLALVDDQTVTTRSAISVMERNALIGFALVLTSMWLFLGAKIALLTSIGIPFILGGTFLVLHALGQTLNVTVLLGIVISLGMLVDDAIVIVEAIYFQIQHGQKGITAAISGLREVGVPVSTATLTTAAAFLPLMLLPGVLGDFMQVVPIVVTVALAISLVEAFWILPSHIIESRPRGASISTTQRTRDSYLHKIKKIYTTALIASFRRPMFVIAASLGLLFSAGGLLGAGLIRIDFFATDEFPLFYVNVEMPPGTSIEATSDELSNIEHIIRQQLRTNEVRALVNYAGQQITDREVLVGNERGQIFVSLNSRPQRDREIDELISACRTALENLPGPVRISFLKRKTGPPTSKPINIKVRGDNILEIRRVAAEVVAKLDELKGVTDVTDDDTEGGMALSLRLNSDAVTRSQLSPADIIRTVRLLADGEIVSSMQHQGDKVDVRVKAKPNEIEDIRNFLNHRIGLPNGDQVALDALLDSETNHTTNNIFHHNFRRALTITADLDPDQTNTLTANRVIQRFWDSRSAEFPGISLDFSGEVDDIQESLSSMALLFLMGLGLIYLILGTQFGSYTQPLLVLLTVPMAFVGVVFGLAISANPLSLFTLYGVIALAGIAANNAIVLISAANQNLRKGWPAATAVLLASRRRLVPIVITSFTTMAGLFSLATGLGGQSLMWAPVATAIVWGIAFSTTLTLFVVPVATTALLKQRPYTTHSPVRTLGLEIGIKGWGVSVLRRTKYQLGLGEGIYEEGLKDALSDPVCAHLYEEGLEGLLSGDLEHAIRCFQQLSDDHPAVPKFHLLASQALIAFMQKIGWDVGYMARAKKHLFRAKQLAPPDATVSRLEEAISELETSA